MSWSLNEVEALARKAARGAGYSWGHAEEAGRAVRWLCAQGLSGAEALAGLLDQTDGQPYDALCPDPGSDPWQARGAALCPLIAGSALCDDVSAVERGLDLGPVHQPLLLLPFVAMSARARGAGLCLHHAGGVVCVDPEGQMEGAAPALGGPMAMKIAPCDAVKGAKSRASRAYCDAGIMERLGKFAARTYAPASEASRLAGAGAGTTDND